MHSQLLKGGMPKKAEGFSDVMVRTFGNSDASVRTGVYDTYSLCCQ